MRQPRSWRSTSTTSNVAHRLAGRAAHLAVEAEHRDSVDRVDEVGAFDHIVLLVAAQPVLRAERGGQADVGASGERVEAVREVARDRGGMRDQRDALAVQRGAQRRVGEQPFDTEFHARRYSGSRAAKQAGSWKSGGPSGWASAQ